MDPPRADPATGRGEILVENEKMGFPPNPVLAGGWVERCLGRGRFVDVEGVGAAVSDGFGDAVKEPMKIDADTVDNA